MSTEIKVPDIGDFDAVEVIEVLVAAGDTVEVDQPLITLESDKATMEVPSTVAGKLVEMKIAEGDSVAQGDVIALVEDQAEQGQAEEGRDAQEQGPAEEQNQGEDDSDAAHEQATAPARSAARPDGAAPPSSGEQDSPAGAEAQSANTGTASSAPRSAAPAGQAPGSQLAPIDEKAFDTAHASPSVRKYARELGVDLGRVRGSGRKGRILRENVQEYVKQIVAHARQPGAAGAGAGLPEQPEPDYSQFGDVDKVELARIRKLSARAVHRSWLLVPHVTQFDEADITDLEDFRKAQKTEAEKRGVKLTMLAFLLKAAAATLEEFPDLNSSLSADGEHLWRKHYVNIGVAVDTEGGLVVPVIRNVNNKGVFELAGELGEVSQRARAGKLSGSDLKGGCFSISSLGGIGGTAFTPIVNAPEVAILGVSRAAMQPVWDGEQFVARLKLPLSLSYDHRVIDGAMAARVTGFMSRVLGDIRTLLL